MKYLITIVITAAITMAVCMYIYKHQVEAKSTHINTVIDTIYVINKIRDTVPILQTKYLNRIIIDTLYTTDSIQVPVTVPISNYEYSNTRVSHRGGATDTISYRAYLSGYRTSLDSIDISVKYPQYNTTTTIRTSNKKQWYNRFNYSIQMGVGYGIINKRPDIYVGAGISYSF